MTREDVTDLIVMAKVKKGIKWADVAKKVGQSKEWATAACLGQMQMTKKQAETVGKIFGLPDDAVLLLQQVPYKGSLPTAVPTDPLIYRLYEIVNVYGTTIKELIHEEFGDGIMSAIDFNMDISARARSQGRPRQDRDERASSCPTRPIKADAVIWRRTHCVRGRHCRLTPQLLVRFVQSVRGSVRQSFDFFN